MSKVLRRSTAYCRMRIAITLWCRHKKDPSRPQHWHNSFAPFRIASCFASSGAVDRRIACSRDVQAPRAQCRRRGHVKKQRCLAPDPTLTWPGFWEER